MTALIVILWFSIGVVLAKNWNKAADRLPPEFQQELRLDSPAQKGATVFLWPGMLVFSALLTVLALAYMAMAWLGRKI